VIHVSHPPIHPSTYQICTRQLKVNNKNVVGELQFIYLLMALLVAVGAEYGAAEATRTHRQEELPQ